MVIGVACHSRNNCETFVVIAADIYCNTAVRTGGKEVMLLYDENTLWLGHCVGLLCNYLL